MKIARFILLLIFLAPFGTTLGQSLPSGFALDLVDWTDGANMGISLEFGPNGRMYVGEKNGRVMTYAPNGTGGYLAPTVYADLSAVVDTAIESGLLGLAIDPDFASNRFMYLFYTTFTDQRLVRVTANASYDAAVGSPVVLLSGLPRSQNFHNAGDIEFHPNEPNNIYISLGDDGISFSERAERCPNPDYYEGKLLRVNKSNGQGIADNPFYDGNPSSVRSRVWATGFRNPFRVAFHPQAPVPDVIYVSENGDDIDRISWVRRGSDGDWGTGNDFVSVPDPDHRILISTDPSVIGVAIATSGPFASGGNPVLYVSTWVGGTSFGTGIRRFLLTGASLDTATPLDGGGWFLVSTLGTEGFDLTFGPDGALYLACGVADARIVQRIRAVGGISPSASFTTAPTPPSGAAPLVVSFDDTSTDPDGFIASRLWQFGDGTTSTTENPVHSYASAGSYAARLTVTDNWGLQTTSLPTTVTVTVTTIVTFSGQLYDGRSLGATPLPVATELRLYQANGTTPIAFAGGGGPQGNALNVSIGGAISSTTLSLGLTAPGLVVSAGEPLSDALQPAIAGYGVALGAASQSVVIDMHLSDTAIRGRVLDTQGAPAIVDIGTARDNPTAWYAVAGGRDYLPGSGLAPTGAPFRVESDGFGYFYIPIRTGTAGPMFFFDAVADTGAGSYLAAANSAFVPSGTLVTINFVLGLLLGGSGCDDLSAIPVQSGIDYLSHIQPIWNSSCTGCHHPAGYPPDLESDSAAHLVGVVRSTSPALTYVTPGDLNLSFLFEKINCASPQIGVRMRPGSPLSLSNQALIRDWILGLSGDTFDRADPNADGAFNLADPVAVLLHLFTGLATTCRSAFDSNDDEMINVADPVFLLSALFAGGPLPPEPFSACATDPTPGMLSCVDFSACP
ncbi:MAG: PQQ-dependent sugar dehydrogenase [Planctomycetota bacterium]